jgi:hypothetical protein
VSFVETLKVFDGPETVIMALIDFAVEHIASIIRVKE